jgi:hypothetical protein
MNLLVARAVYREAARLIPEDLIELRQGARVIERRSEEETSPCRRGVSVASGAAIFKIRASTTCA